MSHMQYFPPEFIHPLVIGSSTNTATTLAGRGYEVILDAEFKEDKPVSIMDGKIEVAEDLIEEGKIYPIFYKNENFYVRRKGKAIELFQIEE